MGTRRRSNGAPSSLHWLPSGVNACKLPAAFGAPRSARNRDDGFLSAEGVHGQDQPVTASVYRADQFNADQMVLQLGDR